MTDYKWEVTDVFEYIELLVAEQRLVRARTLAEYDSYTAILWSEKMDSLLESLGGYPQVPHLYNQRIRTAHKVSLVRQGGRCGDCGRSRGCNGFCKSEHSPVLLTAEIIP